MFTEKRCPRTYPHRGPHQWVRDAKSPVFGNLRVEFTCLGKEAQPQK